MVRTAACTLAAAILVSVFAAACGGDAKKKAVTATAVVLPTRHAAAVITGDGTVDQVIDAALRTDDIALAGLTGYQRVACKTGSAEEVGTAPLCRESEVDGASVEVLASSTCTNGWIRPEQVPDAFRVNLAPDKPELVEVIKPRFGPTTYGGGFGSTVAVVIRSRTTPDGQPGGVALHLNNGRIAWIQTSCLTLDELIAPDKVETVIFDARTPAASSSATASPAAPTPTP